MNGTSEMGEQRGSAAGWLLRRGFVLFGAIVAAGACFAVLPVIQAITEPAEADTLFSQVEAAVMEADEPEPEPEIEEEPEPEPEPEPEINNEPQAIDLAQLDAALNAGIGEGVGASFSLDLSSLLADTTAGLGEFDLGGMGSDVRPLHTPNPSLSPKLRKKLKQRSIKVVVVFLVDERGKVVRPKIDSSDDPAFNSAVIKAVRQWKYEPRKVNGAPVSAPVRQPFVFPRSN